MANLSLNLTEAQKSFLEALYEESLKSIETKGDPRSISKFIKTIGVRWYGYEKLQKKLAKLERKTKKIVSAKDLLKNLSSRKSKSVKTVGK